MTDTPAAPIDASPAKPSSRRPGLLAVAGAALLLGGGLLVAGQHDTTSTATPLKPGPIAALKDSGPAAVKGTVTEIFGNKFVLQDDSGRALVETGREGEAGKLVTKGETIEVQGRFAHDALRAGTITHADNRRVVVGPLSGPPGPLERAKERIGLWPTPDVPDLTAKVQAAGYSDVRILGRGPHHLEVVARGSDGKDHGLHVDFDGRVREFDKV